MTLLLYNKEDIEKYGISIEGRMGGKKRQTSGDKWQGPGENMVKKSCPSVKFPSSVYGSELTLILLVEM